jgi:hypothetical protein
MWVNFTYSEDMRSKGENQWHAGVEVLSDPSADTGGVVIVSGKLGICEALHQTP